MRATQVERGSGMVAAADDEIITDARGNPGWSIRVGISKSQAEALDEADREGKWFDSVEDMDAYVNAHINRTSDEEGETTAAEEWVEVTSL